MNKQTLANQQDSRSNDSCIAPGGPLLGLTSSGDHWATTREERVDVW